MRAPSRPLRGLALSQRDTEEAKRKTSLKSFSCLVVNAVHLVWSENARRATNDQRFDPKSTTDAVLRVSVPLWFKCLFVRDRTVGKVTQRRHSHSRADRLVCARAFGPHDGSWTRYSRVPSATGSSVHVTRPGDSSDSACHV